MMSMPLKVYGTFKLLKEAIKDWYQQIDVGDPFRISQLEEDIEIIDKCMLVN